MMSVAPVMLVDYYFCCCCYSCHKGAATMTDVVSLLLLLLLFLVSLLLLTLLLLVVVVVVPDFLITVTALFLLSCLSLPYSCTGTSLLQSEAFIYLFSFYPSLSVYHQLLSITWLSIYLAM